MSDATFEGFETRQIDANPLEIDVNTLSSVTLARLIDEVRNEEPTTAHSYDRTHNRHNR
jgi:hypothetical protein